MSAYRASEGKFSLVGKRFKGLPIEGVQSAPSKFFEYKRWLRQNEIKVVMFTILFMVGLVFFLAGCQYNGLPGGNYGW